MVDLDILYVPATVAAEGGPLGIALPDPEPISGMPKSKKPHYTKESSEPELPEGEGVPITFPNSLSGPLPYRLPRVFTRPPQVPSRSTMWFIYLVIALTCALVIVGCVMAAVRG